MEWQCQIPLISYEGMLGLAIECPTEQVKSILLFEACRVCQGRVLFVPFKLDQ
jgi:hypothetical protein